MLDRVYKIHIIREDFCSEMASIMMLSSLNLSWYSFWHFATSYFTTCRVYISFSFCEAT
jgi:hypothetical protein